MLGSHGSLAVTIVTIPMNMPTRTCDVVITVGSALSLYDVRSVMQDGEQSARPSAYRSGAAGLAPAVALARRMTDDCGGGAIYMLDFRTLTWTKLTY